MFAVAEQECENIDAGVINDLTEAGAQSNNNGRVGTINVEEQEHLTQGHNSDGRNTEGDERGCKHKEKKRRCT